MKSGTMKERIGHTAGAIWRALEKTKEVDAARLPAMVNEKSFIVHQALGWLAREDKIDYRSEGEKVFVSLLESERKK